MGGKIKVRRIFLLGSIMLLSSKLYCQALEFDTTAFKNEINMENVRLYFDQAFNKQQLNRLLISENLYHFIVKDQVFTRINIDKDSIRYTIFIIKAKKSKITRPIIKSCYLESKCLTFSSYLHIGSNIIFSFVDMPMNLGDIEREDRKLTLYKLLLCTTRYCQKTILNNQLYMPLGKTTQ